MLFQKFGQSFLIMAVSLVASCQQFLGRTIKAAHSIALNFSIFAQAYFTFCFEWEITPFDTTTVICFFNVSTAGGDLFQQRRRYKGLAGQLQDYEQAEKFAFHSSNEQNEIKLDNGYNLSLFHPSRNLPHLIFMSLSGHYSANPRSSSTFTSVVLDVNITWACRTTQTNDYQGKTKNEAYLWYFMVQMNKRR